MDTLFWAALQSSFILGLIHGINPCGHSWLVLAPFTMGEKRGLVVTRLTLAFVGGTALACLLLGATLGTISSLLPPSAGFWVDVITSSLLLLLGIILIWNPHILHSHDHSHEHHHHDDEHSCSHHTQEKKKSKKWLATSLFGIGFVNMIIPCPTAAIMYGYALNSGNVTQATMVFGSYALSTAIAVGGVIFIIFKITSMASKLQKEWIEPAIMRSAGLIIILFSGYGLYSVLQS